MKTFLNRILRPCKKWTDILPIAAVLSFLMVAFGQLAGSFILSLGVSDVFKSVAGDESSGVFLGMYFSFIGIWIVSILYMLIFKANRPMLKAVRHNRRGNTFGWGLRGLLIGFGMNGLCILISALMGDIKLTFNAIDPLLILLFFVCVAIQSGAEELADRVYLYQKLRRRYRHPAVAILGNALVFAAMHLGNPNVGPLPLTQIVLIGVLFSLYVYYYGSFWCPVMIHTGWNFSQSIIFGLPNSGIVSAYSIFKLDAASARNGLFYNVGFGVEGSAGACAVIALVLVIVFLRGRQRKYREDIWKPVEEQLLAAEAAEVPAEPAE